MLAPYLTLGFRRMLLHTNSLHAFNSTEAQETSQTKLLSMRLSAELGYSSDQLGLRLTLIKRNTDTGYRIFFIFTHSVLLKPIYFQAAHLGDMHGSLVHITISDAPPRGI